MEGPKPISQFDPAAAFTVDDFLCGIAKTGEAQYNNVKMPRSVLDALYYSATNPSGYLSAISKAMVEAVLTGEISTHSHADTDPVFTAWRDATRTANHAFMAPGVGGVPTWRQIDYSDLANTPTIPTGFTLSSDLLSGGTNTLNAYTTNQAAQRRFYTTADTPTGTNRLNIGAYFYATRLYEGTNRVVTGTPWTSVGYLIGSNNLSDVANATTARSNLGLGTAATINTGTTEGTIPILGTGGKLSTLVLPELAISDTYVVSSQAAQLALTVQKGDLAVRSDLNKSYINSTGNNTGMSDWVELLSPPNAVSSVFGRTGAVVATSGDYTTTLVAEGTNLYFTDARAQAAITGGASTIVTSNLTVSRALVSNSSGKVAISAVTSTELGYLAGVSSAIQNQLNGKQPSLDSSTSVILSSNTLQRAALSGDVSAAQNNNAVTVTGIRDKSITLGPGYLRYTGSAWEFRNETYLTSETTYTFASGTTNGAFSVTPSGGSAQSVAIYGLDTAAYRKAQTSATDTTANSLMQVGAFGLGTITPVVSNLDVDIPTGFYRYAANTVTGTPPETTAYGHTALLNHYQNGVQSGIFQRVTSSASAIKAWIGSRTSVGAFNYQELYHTGNLGTGTSGYIPFWTGANTMGTDSEFQYSTTSKVLSAGRRVHITAPASGQQGINLNMTTTGASPAIRWLENGVVAAAIRTNNGRLDIGTGWITERLSITSGGNVLIGTTTDDTTSKLQVNGNVNITGNIKIGTDTIIESYGTSGVRDMYKFYGFSSTHSLTLSYGRYGISASSYVWKVENGDSNRHIGFYNYDGSPFIFMNAASNAVAIGKTSVTSGYKFDVNGAIMASGNIRGNSYLVGATSIIDSSRNATFSTLFLYQTGASSGLNFNNYEATIVNSVNPLNSIYIGDDIVQIASDDAIELAGNVGISGSTTLATSLTGLLKASSGLVSVATAGSDYTKPLAKVYTMSVFSDSAISDAFTYTIPANTLSYNGSAIKCEFVVEQMMGTPSSSIVQLNFDGNTTTYTPNTGDWGPAGMHFTFTIMRTSSSEVRISRLAKGVVNISGWWDDSSAYATVAFSSIDFTSAITLKLSGKSGNSNIGTYLAMATLTLI